jgi:hypothetical protein
MLSKRTLIACVTPYFCTALIACVASQADDDAPVTPVRVDNGSPPAASSVLSPTAPTPSPSASAQASSDAGDADASIDASAREPALDASADAPPPPTLDCSQPDMWTSAPTNACALSSATDLSGGTITIGRYYLSQWADGATSCTSKSLRQGTMSIEEMNGRQYLRWVITIDGRTNAGVFALIPGATPSTMSRKEVCRKLAVTDPATPMTYAATSTEIHFVFNGGQETWKRIPKQLPTDYPLDPVIGVK